MMESKQQRITLRINASGDKAANNRDGSTVVRTKNMHISSPILAATSPFFYTLFSNGMMESKQQRITLRINASEEAALMELISFVYSNTLSTTTSPEVLEILIIADKFEVASCMEYCCGLLRDMPMKPDDALLYLELPSSVLKAKMVQPLKDKAVQLIADKYKDITKFQDEVLELSLAGIQAVLSSDDLLVQTEDDVCDIVLKWANSHHPKLKDRQDIIGTHLIHLIRFPYMTFSKLKTVLQCDDLSHELSTKAMLEALLFKSGTLHHKQAFIAEVSTSTSHRFVERAYIYRPVNVLEFDYPRQQCVAYLDLKREECAKLYPSGIVNSQTFHLGGQGYYLQVVCCTNNQQLSTMGLNLCMSDLGPVSIETCFKIALRTKPTDEYVDKYIFTYPKRSSYHNLFQISMTQFIAKESLYFINNILHLRVELTIKKFQEEVLELSLAGIRAVLSSDDLQVQTEDDVCDIVLKWANSHYPKLKDRQDIIATHLIHLIRFPYMTFSKLKTVLQCDDLSHELSTKAMLEALLFKSGTLHHKQAFMAEVSTSTNHRFVERAYMYRPVNVLAFDYPRQQCVVYLDLEREECAKLFPSGSIHSQTFHLGGQGFHLQVKCNTDGQQLRTMGLYLCARELDRVSIETCFKFAARTKPTEEYVSKLGELKYVFSCVGGYGYINLFQIPWTKFIAEESLYFINNILHLRAEITIKK